MFTSFNDFPTELVADKPASIVIVGGSCSSRAAVANRLLGSNVLPAPRCSVAWHTLQFVDTDCVRSFSGAVNTVWSWVNTVPRDDIEFDSTQKTVQGAEVRLDSSGNFKSEFMRTAPVVKVLMSHPLLRAGGQVIVCGDNSSINTVQFAVTDVIPVVIFVVSNGELSEKVRNILQWQLLLSSLLSSVLDVFHACID